MQKGILLTKRKLNVKTAKGFSLVEVLLSIALFSLFVLGIAGAINFSVQSQELTSYKQRAVFLMDEGLEAVRSIRNEAYAGLTDGAHGLGIVSNKWAFSGASDAIGEFTRTVTVSTVDSTTKQVVATVSWPAQFSPVNSVTSTMYLTNWYRSVVIASRANPTLTSTLDITSSQDGVKVKIMGNYAYVIRTSGNPTFAVVDITNAASPTIAASLTLTGNSTDIAIQGNYAYISSSDNSGELKIINITNPLAPTLAATLNLPGNQDGLSIFTTATNLYLGRANGTTNEFNIFNLVNPIAPVLLSSLDITGSSNDITVSGNYAYIASTVNSAEVRIVNISNPLSIAVNANINLPGNLSGISLAINSNTIYIGTNSTNVFSYNITNPLSPTLLDSVATGASTTSELDVGGPSNTLLYAATNNSSNELRVIDVTNPAAMTIFGSNNTASTLTGLDYDPVNDIVCAVGTNNSGEFIIISPN